MKNIVIIEKNRSYAKMLRNLFRDHYNVKVYHRGMLFLNELQDLSPDLILINYALPDIFGLQVIQKVRESFKKVPVIVHDIENNQLVTAHSLSEGADAYVVKEEDSELVLYQVMHKLMRKREEAKIVKQRVTFGWFGLAFLFGA